MAALTAAAGAGTACHCLPTTSYHLMMLPFWSGWGSGLITQAVPSTPTLISAAKFSGAISAAPPCGPIVQTSPLALTIQPTPLAVPAIFTAAAGAGTVCHCLAITSYHLMILPL